MATYIMPFVDAEKPTGVQYTLTASAAALSSSALLGNNRTPSKLTVKNASDAANPVYLGGPDVANTPANAWVELGTGQAYTFNYMAPNEIYIVGTVAATNIAYIVAEYSDRRK